jgi:2-oxoisovalerate dehydrogenase E1 component
MSQEKVSVEDQQEITFEDFKEEILNDYTIVNLSREASYLGRREVLTGKAKFGIFGDGKEVAQIAMAKQFKNGDFRSGYYRDQTFMLAIRQLTVQQFFAQLYAHTDLEAEPASVGRQMNGHYATRSLNDDGSWKALTQQKNSSADISPTAGQMPRLLGLAYASKVFRQNEGLTGYDQFSINGNEVAFGTIGDASTSEGLFWETVNAAGVLQVPMALSVWDDGYGISVSKKFQTTKESISQALSGFQKEEETNGYEIYTAKGWDYAGLCSTYEEAIQKCRDTHTPALIHVEEMTQPQGHSTSGSHERYKSKERLQWAKDFDCIAKFRAWILDYEKEFGKQLATAEELEEIEKATKKQVRTEQKAAWAAYLEPIKEELNTVVELLEELATSSSNSTFITKIKDELKAALDPIRKDIISAAKKTLRLVRNEQMPAKQKLIDWLNESKIANHDRYSSYLHSHSADNAMSAKAVPAAYADDAPMVDGRILLRDNFETIFNNEPLALTFGEDTGKIGGVNQSMEGMQEQFGEIRVSDTGIREATIIGQGIGMAMRGLRPIAEIQYLDYLLYAIQIMSDDLATVQYRTKGGQKAPLIVRTRGHRLEGIWHSGSPMGMVINALRGVYVCVPRNMTQAAGMYNTLIASDDPALVIEPLNGYRKKEKQPSNLGEFKIPLGVPETVKEGTDVTIVSYGSTFNMCEAVGKQLEEVGISAELIDVQTLLPFDVNHMIVESLKKTNRLVVVDEDVPGGATAYMLDKILTEQGGYFYLDSEPVTVSAKDHRPAYASDGDYFSKPSTEDIFDAVYEVMNEVDPETYPAIY